VDRLREQGWSVRAINFGSAPDASRNDERFLNRRTELWWNLREWIRKDAALGDLPPETQDLLRADLTAPKYEQRSDGRIALEPKYRIRERTGRSPDHGDALALALVPRFRAPTSAPAFEPRDDRDRPADGYDRSRGARSVREMRRPGGPLEGYMVAGRGLDDW